jgi:hypothetical protein
MKCERLAELCAVQLPVPRPASPPVPVGPTLSAVDTAASSLSATTSSSVFPTSSSSSVVNTGDSTEVRRVQQEEGDSVKWWRVIAPEGLPMRVAPNESSPLHICKRARYGQHFVEFASCPGWINIGDDRDPGWLQCTTVADHLFGDHLSDTLQYQGRAMWHSHWRSPGLMAVARVLEPGHTHFVEQQQQQLWQQQRQD